MPPFPDMAEALSDLTEALQFQVIGKQMQDGELKEVSSATVKLRGNIQPVPPQKLLIKPQGQRQWKWWTLYTQAILKNDWIIEDNSQRQFRVMSVTDWGTAGYRQYEIVQQPI